jgi:O-antigen/teichoic acid export membrane protein
VTFGLRGAIGIFLMFLAYRLDLILVNLLIGPADAGIYAISTRLAELLWLLPTAVGTLVFANSAGRAGTEMNTVTPRAFWATTLVSVGVAIAMAATGWILIPVVFSPAYALAYAPMVLLLPGAVLIGSASVLANDLAGRGRPGIVTLATIVTFAATIGLDLTLIPTLGIRGAALASSVSYAAYFLALLALYLRVAELDRRQLLSGALFWREAESPRDRT